MKTIYTREELYQEINTLQNFFDYVRLVSPSVCRTYYPNPDTNTNGEESRLPNCCYHIMDEDRHCINCISIRAIQQKNIFTKFACIEGRLCIVMAKYIRVDGQEFSLETIKDIGGDVPGVCDENQPASCIARLNMAVSTDPVTQVYDRQFVNEHLSYIVYHTREGSLPLHLMLIRIENLDDIYNHLGQTACVGVLKSMASYIAGCQQHQAAYEFLARYTQNSFLMASCFHTYEEWREKLTKLLQNAPFVPILFNEEKISVRLCCGLVTSRPSSGQDMDALLLAVEACLAEASLQLETSEENADGTVRPGSVAAETQTPPGGGAEGGQTPLLVSRLLE